MNKQTWIIIGAGIAIVVLAFLGFSRSRENRVPEAKAAVDTSAQELYQQASKLESDHELVKAKDTFQKIVTEHPDYENIAVIQKELEKLNIEVLFSNVQTPKTIIHEVAVGDTIGKIARKYGTTNDLIKRSNGLKSDVIRVGQKLRIWKGNFNIFVDKSQNILMLKDGNEIVKVYRVSTGENNITPVGTYKITSRLIDPVWFNKGIAVPPESPQNVLGTRWLGFDIPGYGIHGTIEPETIGQQVTAGCVRMRNEDVEELYTIVPTGTEVVIVD